ncbi:MAG: adenylate/guanylate cyclase domain-containing protein [Methylococcaceae bacterium]
MKQNDFSGKFEISQKLYGRENETSFLMEAFERCAEGNLEIVLVEGYSGTGKSALVREVHKPITQRKGYFIEGKYDQFQRVVPYYALLQAFIEFVNILLTEKEEKLNQLRIEIQKAVGAEGKVLTDVILNLEFIIGQQPDVPEIGGAESQNRFNYVFKKFVSVISTKEHPLVLFIDDLQWADSASLSLLNVLLTDKQNGYLLCIGAYRDNEVSASHPFSIMLGEMRKKGAKTNTITIGNLSEETLNNLISDSVNEDKSLTRELTNLVYVKTHGNAFFVMQFLKSLYTENLLTFNFESHRWLWDVKKVKEQNITDNVVELMAGKIRVLPQETQRAMKLAACIGNSFSVSTLAVINQQEIAEIHQALFEGLREGLLIPSGDHIRFSHDRIQQAVYSLIPDKEKNLMHLSIGKLLLSNIPAEQQEEKLFDIVNQWNWGKEIIISENEKEQLAKLNLRAGIKAKQSSAFKPALDYLETGISLLKPEPWNNQYQLCLDLYTYATEAAYLNGDFALMDKMFEEVLTNAKDLLEKVKPYEIRILAYKAENKLLDAIKTGLELLAQLEEEFPSKPTILSVMADLIKTRIMLRGKDSNKLQNLPVMTNEYKIAAMRIMADIASSSYWATPTLFPLVIFRMVHLSLRYGNTAVSAFAFATYGVILCGVLGDMKSGYSFGKLGLVLLDKFNAKEWKTQIYTPIYALINNWNEHIHNTLRPLQESYHIGLETGAIEFACINTNIYCIHSYLSGKRLPRLEEETKAYSESFHAFKQETNFNYNEVYRQPMLNFMGRSANPTVLTGEAYDEEKMMLQNTERNDKTGAFFIHFNKLILCYYFQDYEKALYHSEESRKLLEAVLAKFEIPNHHLYEALTMLALYPKASAYDKSKYMKRVKSNMGKIKKWAKDAPQNYLHKYHMLEAEKLRILGKLSDARMVYDKAIEGASNNDYIHEEALAYELTGKFYLEQKSEDLSEFYLKASYNAYREWGAIAKLHNLEQNYPKYVSGVLRREGSISESANISATTSMVRGAILDITTVLKAATAISGEIILPKLLSKLMDIVIENAGAQYGFLILEKNGELIIEAQSLNEKGAAIILQHIPLDNSNLLSEAIVKYVKRTGESVVINDAVNDTRYENDVFIKEHKPKSILSLPVFNQGKFIGVLYLGNNLTTGAFTQERIDLLSLLSGQIAVSIDNAVLYDQMDQNVKSRTAELAEEKKKSDDLLYNILPAETAEELKREGRAKPRKYESVTVMFTDFKGFTIISENLNAEELVTEIDSCFGKFDEIMDKYGIEKIKTIGDSYMCAGGLPVQNSTHAEDVVKAAKEIQQWMREHNLRRIAANLPPFEIRIGLHSGSVVAGVVGSKKFAFDIWGDTVNTASRMESSGEASQINISGSTYELIKNKFHCTYRGKISAKNKGDIDMYFVDDVNK